MGQKISEAHLELKIPQEIQTRRNYCLFYNQGRLGRHSKQIKRSNKRKMPALQADKLVIASITAKKEVTLPPANNPKTTR